MLLDSDVVAIKPLSESFLKIVRDGVPARYSWSNYRLAEARNRQLLREICADVDAEAFPWAGGEFIGGTASFYKKLLEKIDAVLPDYFRVLAREGALFHVGDELPVSIAWNLLEKSGMQIADAGNLGVIFRYWGNAERRSLNACGTSLIHLPADKVFLSRVDLKKLKTPKDFERQYRKQRARNFAVAVARRLHLKEFFVAIARRFLWKQ